ncbi:MAG: D-alanine--D-alanine ligase [Clostridia bacterium]|jgi:D-alanine-D-alanine ligase|nr:D-alanine--D-alanine ligase [Clostridia bacterium]
MSKIKLGVIFGGMSTEHEVSIVSATSVIQNLDKNKYEIYPIYIGKEGNWYRYTKKIEEIQVLKIGEEIKEKEKIENVIEYLKNIEVVFPVLHGIRGEDGSIQGLLELLKIKYVGCKILASAICLDKAYSKIVFEKAGIPQAKYMYIKAEKETYYEVDEQMQEKIQKIEEIIQKVKQTLGFPVFVKPSNLGSSVGIRKAKNEKELKEAIEYAKQFDTKILIEQEIIGREVECAVLGNEKIEASCVGEILAAEDFYTFDAKYKNVQSKVVIPAKIAKEKQEEIKKLAIKAFKAVDGKGLSRVDFFIKKENEEIYINEINTLPGFTEISMYPKLWQASGLSYTHLLDRLIELAC